MKHTTILVSVLMILLGISMGSHAASVPELTVQRQSCLMGCERHCNTAITAPGKLTYVLGMFTPTQALHTV